ncbi:hypothetical protein COCCADRAFT_92887, partial [Bipolaris zeicola 26-R-13]
TLIHRPSSELSACQRHSKAGIKKPTQDTSQTRSITVPSLHSPATAPFCVRLEITCNHTLVSPFEAL